MPMEYVPIFFPEEPLKSLNSTDRLFDRFVFVMEIRLAYRGELIGLISALAGFSL